MNQGSYGVGIIGLGKYVPERRVTSEAVEEEAGIIKGDIFAKTGIAERRIAGELDSASGFSIEAGRMALERSGGQPDDIGLVLCCTFTGDYVYPALACKIHQALKTTNAGAFDLMANCTGFQVGLSTACEKMLLNPEIRYSLVVGTALQSRYINWKDASSAMYFGDGAAAAVLGQVPKGYGLQSTEILTNSNAYDAVRMRGGGSSFPMTHENVEKGLQYYELNGLEVWKQVIQHQPKVIRAALDRIGKKVEDVDFFIFHQAGLRLIEYLMGRMKVPMSKTFTNLEHYGNTAEASMGLALCEAVEEGRLKRGDLVVMSGVGAGFTFGASTFVWY